MRELISGKAIHGSGEAPWKGKENEGCILFVLLRQGDILKFAKENLAEYLRKPNPSIELYYKC